MDTVGDQNRSGNKLCPRQWGNCVSCWNSRPTEHSSTSPRQTVWIQQNTTKKLCSGALFLWMSDTGTSCSLPFCSLYERYHNPPLASQCSSCFYGNQPQEILDLIWEMWEQPPPWANNMVQYILNLQEKLEALCSFAKENLLHAQSTQKAAYNKKACLRMFQSSGQVLLLLPSSVSKLLACWQGPYEVKQWVELLNYKVPQPDKQKLPQIYHETLLKPWKAQESLLIVPYPPEPKLGPQAAETSKLGMVKIRSNLTQNRGPKPSSWSLLSPQCSLPDLGGSI